MEDTDTTTTLSNAHLTLKLSDTGAELQSLKTANGHELLWQGDPAYWTGRAPVLFPIVGAAPDNQIVVGDHHAEMAQHGFARRSLFQRTAQDTQMCRHTLRDSAATRAVYPFAFALHITHQLEGPRLSVTAHVENHSDRVMPFGFGFHPAFCWPLPGVPENTPHQIVLENGAEPALARLQDGLLTRTRLPSPFKGGQLTLTQEMFETNAMVFPRGAGDALGYGPATGPKLAFAFEGLPNLALWTKPGAPFICIEPWHGMAAVAGEGPQIECRPDTILLPQGEVATFAMHITWA